MFHRAKLGSTSYFFLPELKTAKLSSIYLMFLYVTVRSRGTIISHFSNIAFVSSVMTRTTTISEIVALRNLDVHPSNDGLFWFSLGPSGWPWLFHSSPRTCWSATTSWSVTVYPESWPTGDYWKPSIIEYTKYIGISSGDHLVEILSSLFWNFARNDDKMMKKKASMMAMLDHPTIKSRMDHSDWPHLPTYRNR